MTDESPAPKPDPAGPDQNADGVHRGPLPDIEIPDVSLYELLFENLTPEDADRLAFASVETGEEHTFGRLRHDTDAVATWFDQRGLKQGDVVALALPNLPEFAALFHGVALTGAASTTVNIAASAPDMGRQLRITGASWIVTVPELLPLAMAAAGPEGMGADRVIVVGGDPDEARAAGHLPYADLLATEPNPPRGRVTDPATHVACLPFSSGTSGMPKAVRLSHRNLVANMMQFDEVIDSPGGESLIAFLPFTHIYSLTTNLNYGVYRRFAQYTMSAFRSEPFLETIARRRPTLLFVVPPVANLLANHPAVDSVPWDSVRLVISGAASLDPTVATRLIDRLGIRLVQGYGMTELSPVSHVTPPGRTDIGVDTIGLAIPNIRFRVVDDETGRDVDVPAEGWSERGELWVAGPNTMLGYLDEPERTADVLDADGYVHTGDLVQVNAEGVVRVVDRIKELIKYKGLQIAPVELEAHLMAHPEVVDAAVVGVETSNGDQLPHALLVLAPGATSTADQVLADVNPGLSSYKHMRTATVVASLPHSSTGKLLRRELPALVD